MSCWLEWQDGFLGLQSAACTAEAVPQTAEPRFGSSQQELYFHVGVQVVFSGFLKLFQHSLTPEQFLTSVCQY